MLGAWALGISWLLLHADGVVGIFLYQLHSCMLCVERARLSRGDIFAEKN